MKSKISILMVAFTLLIGLSNLQAQNKPNKKNKAEFQANKDCLREVLNFL